MPLLKICAVKRISFLILTAVSLAIAPHFEAQQQNLPLVWRVPIPRTEVTPTGLPAVTAKVAFFASNFVFAVDRTSGSVLWKSPVGLFMPRGILLGGSKVYIADDRLRALDIETGKSLWNSDPSPGSEFCVPELRDDKIYVGTDTGKVIAMEASTGKLLTEIPLDSKTTFRSIVTGIKLLGRNIYVSSVVWDDALGATSHGLLTVLGPEYNRVLWTFRSATDRIRSGFTAPVQEAGDRLLIVDGLANRIYSITKDGKQDWMAQGAARSFSIATPLLITEDRIYMGSADANVYSIDRDSGAVHWHTNLHGSIASLSFCGKSILAVGQQIYQLSTSGELEFGPQEPSSGEHLSTSVSSDTNGLVVAGPSAIYEFACSGVPLTNK